MFWFIRASWGFLGCARGTDRWKARRRYFRGIIPATISFIRISWNDKKE